MYILEWFELLKQRRRAGPSGTGYRPGAVVLGLGVTSMLTDISSEMVSSLLPLYLVLHLHMSPLLFGAIDGVYNGLSVLLVALAAGVLADRSRSPKAMAVLGYGLSAACKLLLMAVGGAWTAILLVVGADRLGKGIRSSPRDALISLATPGEHLAAAFGIHRAMDAAGAMIGPLLAFLLLAFLPGSFNLVWFVSFIFGALGVAAILLLVPGSVRVTRNLQPRHEGTKQATVAEIFTGRFARLLCCALLLPAMTLSDGFLYLLLQKASGINAAYMPLFPVATAGAYMVAAAPVGHLADRLGRLPIVVSGYLQVCLLYMLLLGRLIGGAGSAILCLGLLGIYYAATEGVLVAMASGLLPAARRTTGIALLLTAAGTGKMFSSLAFGWLSMEKGNQVAVSFFLVALAAALFTAWRLLRWSHE